MKLEKNQAVLLAKGKKWAVEFNQNGLFQETEEIGRVDAKRFLFLLKEQGYQVFNIKKDGVIVEC